mmetsp:Transcript_35789/g.93887  ORF Transcript_35789/g.93887 Transcript_35789/m.93887 type:complete len:101 (+) Transcript_35789:609-911(+)
MDSPGLNAFDRSKLMDSMVLGFLNLFSSVVLYNEQTVPGSDDVAVLLDSVRTGDSHFDFTGLHSYLVPRLIVQLPWLFTFSSECTRRIKILFKVFSFRRI